ncbi:MAG: sigma-70 family RNA polymerase sigma factor [Clostridia bacterium]|nr:sigma-70 family RNA polymerase sigma factor [Clostridia bacterium]
MRQNEVRKFIEENIKTIFAYALSRVSDKDDAEDLANEIVLAILQSAPRLKDENAFYGYIWAIAGNTYKKFLRKRRHLSFAELDESIPSDADFFEEMQKSEDIKILRRELALLSKEYRECTIAYYFDGLSCGEVAEKQGISPEMVKYYLFKTRKILKEGIGMEQIFGEKSYRPADFHFVTIFSGKYNAEYRNLFDRKLPGNILLSAYYTPMTIRELSMELGVSSAYMEDEIALLEKYGLLLSLPGGKYQTNLLIFTEDYTNEWHRMIEKECTKKVGMLLSHLKEKLSLIRKIGFIGASLDDNRMMWGLYWMLMRKGHALFEKENGNMTARDTIYQGAKGINYGLDYDAYAGEYSADAFAGYVKINECYAAAFADFGILPQKNRFSQYTVPLEKMLSENQVGDVLPEFMIFTKSEISSVVSALSDEIREMQGIYTWLTERAISLMQIHAPAHTKDMIGHIIASTIFFPFGWYSRCLCC